MPLQIDHHTPLPDLYSLGIRQQAWCLDSAAVSRVAGAHARLLQALEEGSQTIYGLHTHFGHNVSAEATAHDWETHQRALLDYLCVGFGRNLDESIVRRALRLQCHKLGLGFSGVHPQTFQRLQKAADAEILPTVPCLGSLGASGDLIPMAHAVREVFSDQPPMGPRDVLALLNTNAMMASLAIDCWHRLQSLQAKTSCGWLLHAEGLGWTDLGFGKIGWQAGTVLSDDQQQWILRTEQWQKALQKKRAPAAATHSLTQERYSIRCAPQIFLDLEDNLSFIGRKIGEEALKLADNPIILDSGIWHGGLFYTSGLATASDLMQNALVRLCDMMDRQILLTVTPEHSHGLPANLGSADPGDHVKGLHQLVSSILQKIKGMSLPAHLLSFSCESNNQDIVPASMSALLLVQESLDLAEEISRIHLLIGERAFHQRHDGIIPHALKLAQQSSYRAETILQEFMTLP